MRWIRRYKRSVAYPALLALLCQLALSFGHGHPAGAGHADGLNASPAELDGAPEPGTPDADRHGDPGYCATCAITALLGGVQIALAPELPANNANIAPSILFTAEQIRSERSPAAFRSRAPPLS
jgi:hypothetical protein